MSDDELQYDMEMDEVVERAPRRKSMLDMLREKALKKLSSSTPRLDDSADLVDLSCWGVNLPTPPPTSAFNKTFASPVTSKSPSRRKCEYGRVFQPSLAWINVKMELSARMAKTRAAELEERRRKFNDDNEMWDGLGSSEAKEDDDAVEEAAAVSEDPEEETGEDEGEAKEADSDEEDCADESEEEEVEDEEEAVDEVDEEGSDNGVDEAAVEDGRSSADADEDDTPAPADEDDTPTGAPTVDPEVEEQGDPQDEDGKSSVCVSPIFNFTVQVYEYEESVSDIDNYFDYEPVISESQTELDTTRELDNACFDILYGDFLERLSEADLFELGCELAGLKEPSTRNRRWEFMTDDVEDNETVKRLVFSTKCVSNLFMV